MATETEIKLRWTRGTAAARAFLQELGYQVRTERQREVDQVYDHPALGLRAAGKLLRLRSAGDQWTLTYKGPVIAGTAHKSREEIETQLTDGPAFHQILDRLGYQPSFKYEKYRTIFMRGREPGIVTLDETPIGDFLELEGTAYWIDETAEILGFSGTEYITASYASLYRKHTESNPQAPADMTF